jgi:hypothetical protein
MMPCVDCVQLMTRRPVTTLLLNNRSLARPPGSAERWSVGTSSVGSSTSTNSPPDPPTPLLPLAAHIPRIPCRQYCHGQIQPRHPRERTADPLFHPSDR